MKRQDDREALRYDPRSHQEVVIMHAGLTTTTEHSQPAALRFVDVTGGTLTTMSTQLQPNPLRDDDETIAQVNFITHKQSTFACSTTTVQARPQLNIKEDVTRKLPSSSSSEILSATAPTATLVEDELKRMLPSSSSQSSRHS